MCTNMPANPQKNADSLYKSPGDWMPALARECVLCTNANSHPEKTSMCRKWGWQVVWQTLPCWQPVWRMAGLMDKTKAGSLALCAYNSEIHSLLLSFLTLWFIFLEKVIPLCCLSFCKARDLEKQPEKHVGVKVGQFSVQFGFPFSCLFSSSYSLHLFVMKRHSFWKSCNYSISCFIYSLLFYFVNWQRVHAVLACSHFPVYVPLFLTLSLWVSRFGVFISTWNGI